MLISNPLEKLQKDSCEKKLSSKNYCVQKFSAYNFFWIIFLHILGFELNIEFCVL
jgi:hypothetical protein